MPTSLKIPEIKGNFYGGFPYSVDLQIGNFDSPSNLNISSINENGQYGKPRLSYGEIVSITVGSLVFNGYLVEYKNSVSMGQKILDLSYDDCSSLLDKIQVGLHKRHGINPDAEIYNSALNFKGIDFVDKNNENPFLIIMGRELHPCDVNKNGIFDEEDASSGSNIDYCDPCPNCPPDKFKYRCKALADIQIFDVGYTFNELCARLKISVPNLPAVNNVVRSYSGNLRSVLQSWCQEFALSFYWDFSATTVSGGLKLFDRSVPITVNANVNECNATEIYNGESIKNSFAASTVTYYKREGNVKNYDCSTSEIYTLQALRLRDLFNKNNYLNLDTKIRWNELAICLSYYSSSLRDCMWWFNYRGIKNASEAKKWVLSDLELNNRLRSNEKAAKTLTEFGNMRIVKVIDAQTDRSTFDLCDSALGDSKKVFTDRSELLNRSENNPSYYFFVAELDKELLITKGDRDASLAKDFIGNHWIKITNAPGCGGQVTNNRFGEVSIDDPEGSSNFYSASSDSIFLDFIKYGHESGSTIDKFLEENDVSSENASTKEVFVDMGNGEQKSFKASKSFIYKQRKASWYPNESEIGNYQQLLDYYKNLCFAFVGISSEGEDSEILSSIDPKFTGNNKLALFVVQEIETNNLPITISKIKNFLEPGKLKAIRGNVEDSGACMSFSQANSSSDGNLGPILGSYGLADNDCAWVTFDGFQFMTPVQGTELFDIITQTSFDPDGTFTTPGYRVRATTNFKMPVCIPKIQKSVIEISDNIDRAARQEMNFQEIGDDDITIMGAKSCVPSDAAIKGIHALKSSATSKSKIASEKTSEYQVVGVAPDGIPKISDGLDSVKITVSDNGVFTTFSLSDKIAEPFSEAVILTQMLVARQMNASNHDTVGDYPAQHAGNLPIVDRS